jgi:hypothetical protein
MSRRPRELIWHAVTASLLVGAVFALTLAAPAGALASSTQQSILQDDNQLIYGTSAHQLAVLRELKSLGVGVVKVSLLWNLVAPDPNSTHKPKFNASNPSAYGWGAWSQYDTLVENAHLLGLRVYFQFVPRDPVWAAAHNVQSGQSFQRSQSPNLRYFQEWVTAVGRRYSGSWVGTNNDKIPRVDEWGIWNEPNWEGSLNPWHKTVDGKQVLTQPSLYRGIVNTAWKGLWNTGHKHDTILLGETADYGNISPLNFLLDVYCVGRRYRPLTGNGAAAVGCPRSPNRSEFIKQNPGLFGMSGWAHHPYGFNLPPNKPDPSRPSEILILNVDKLEKAANGAFGAYHRRRPAGIPIYLSEWGYVTNPPNPVYHTSLRDQATWLNQGEYMTWRDPYVKALSQFELVDFPTPKHQTSHEWARSFTSGLEFQNGKAKPALAAYRIPIWLPSAKHGSHVAVWGQLRPANHFTTQVGEIQFRRKGSSTWRNLHRVTTTNTQGFIFVHVAIGSAGAVRLSWTGPTHTAEYSRTVSIR